MWDLVSWSSGQTWGSWEGPMSPARPCELCKALPLFHGHFHPTASPPPRPGCPQSKIPSGPWQPWPCTSSLPPSPDVAGVLGPIRLHIYLLCRLSTQDPPPRSLFHAPFLPGPLSELILVAMETLQRVPGGSWGQGAALPQPPPFPMPGTGWGSFRGALGAF